MAENTKSPVFSSPSYWVALGAGVVGIAAAAMQERKGSGSAAYRPYTSYGGDPYWMNAKYAGTDAKGLAFKKGERVFYYPKTKTIYAGANAEAAYHDFRSMAEDEDFMGGGGSHNEGSAARGVTEDYVEEYLDGDNIAISTFLNRRLRGKAKSYAGQYARRLKAALDAMVVSGDAYRDTTPNGAVSYRRTATGTTGSAVRVRGTGFAGDPKYTRARLIVEVDPDLDLGDREQLWDVVSTGSLPILTTSEATDIDNNTWMIVASSPAGWPRRTGALQEEIDTLLSVLKHMPGVVSARRI